MNNFCRHLRESLSERYNTEVDAFVSKKKEACSHVSCQATTNLQFF